MANGANGNGETEGPANDPVFDTAQPVDHEWMELSVTTSEGTKAYFRVPRRTLFRGLDRLSVPQGS